MLTLHKFKTLLKILALPLLLQSCYEIKGSQPDSSLADTYAFRTDSPYRERIAKCIQSSSSLSACSLQTLPFIGSVADETNIEEIMNRVVVSHDWMGERFAQLLQLMPPEMLPLFKALTAIVIDADIRPSYYYRGTGAIYLDPATLWLSVEEKQTISLKPDYRSNFGDDLSFWSLWRYLKNGEYAYDAGSLTDNSTRNPDDIVYLLARILLHELAHANDFMPPGHYPNIADTHTARQAIEELSEDWISTRLLEDDMSLESSTMFALAGVMFHGNQATPEQIALSAGEVGAAFEPDGAADDYGYSSQYEDLAMLFEISMMKYWFDVDYELAFAHVPETAPADGDKYLCSELLIGWGVKNRIGDPNVKPRAAFVAAEILVDDGAQLEPFFQQFDAPSATAADWCLPTNESQSMERYPRTKKITLDDRLKPYL